MLKVKHTKELNSKRTQRFNKLVWPQFMETGTNHSHKGIYLTHIIERCERLLIPYRITAMPGTGYFIEQAPEPDYAPTTLRAPWTQNQL